MLFEFLVFFVCYIFFCFQPISAWKAQALIQAGAESPNLQILYDLYANTNGDFWSWHPYPGTIKWDFSDYTADPCIWEGVTCYPNTTIIHEILLGDYNLTGRIPDSLGSLVNLTRLDLSYNQLNGTIPESIWNLLEVNYLSITMNHLFGPLSSAVGNLTKLITLDISHNYFTSILPLEIGNLQNLVVLGAENNNFSGPIPPTIGNLVNVQYLYLSYNNLSSSLPASLNGLISLNHFEFSHNHITGTISPDLFADLPLMEDLYGNYNDLFGNITDDLFPSTMELLDLQANLLSGTLPSSLGKCEETILDFRLSDNSFFGTIPYELIYHFEGLQGFSLANNFLAHSFADLPWEQCVALESINIGNNFFTGKFPEILTLSDFEIRHNFFTGELSEYTKKLANYGNVIEVMDVSHNFFTGSVNLSSLYPVYLNLSYNWFEGEMSNIFGETITCHFALAQCPLLIDVSQNSFSGTLPLNWDDFPQISLIDVSDNQLTGPLPSYSNPTLRVFGASTNCFHGSIPTSLCRTGLEILILNGLSCSPACQSPIFPNTRIHTFVNEYCIDDGIPDCLFNRLPSLKVLHLSGNLLTGKIPEVDLLIHQTSLLNDLDLSYNILTGTIPEFFQKKKNWYKADFSSNQLTGFLLPDAFPNMNLNGKSASLKLSVNRISGTVPAGILGYENIDILDGNMFTCDYDSSLLPDHDPNIDHYSCGSELVSLVLYFWLALFLLLTLILLILGKIYYHSSPERFLFVHLSIQFRDKVSTWYYFFHKYCLEEREKFIRSDNLEQKSNDILTFHRFNRRCRKICLILMFFILVVLLPSFGLLSDYYSTYSDKYAWTVSGLFLTGSTSGWVLFIELLACALLTCGLVMRSFHLSVILGTTAGQMGQLMSWYKFWVYLFFSFVNFIFMLIADVVYVLAIINANVGVAVLAQFVLAVIKIFWNNSVMWKMLIQSEKSISRLYHACCGKTKLKDEETIDFNVNELVFNFSHLDVAVISTSIGLNNLIYPIIAIMAVSTSCFHNAIFQPPAISSSFTGEHVTSIGTTAVMTVTSSYNPPFHYGYQCSSVVYAYYCPVFVIMFTFEGVVIPLIQLSLRFYYENYSNPETRNQAIQNLKNNNLGEDKQGSDEMRLTDSPDESFNFTGKSDTFSSFSNSKPMRERNSNYKNNTRRKSCCPSVHELLPTNLQDLPPPGVFNLTSPLMDDVSFSSFQLTPNTLPYFYKNRYAVKFMSALLIIVAYGTVFPPLAVIGTLSVILRTIYEETVLGRVLFEAKENRYFEFYERQLQKDCKGIVHPIRYCLVIILPISTLLFSYLIFDTFNTSVWRIVSLIPLIAFSMLSIGIIYFTVRDNHQRRRNEGTAYNVLRDSDIGIPSPLIQRSLMSPIIETATANQEEGDDEGISRNLKYSEI
jgi:hypothetical protein